MLELVLRWRTERGVASLENFACEIRQLFFFTEEQEVVAWLWEDQLSVCFRINGIFRMSAAG